MKLGIWPTFPATWWIFPETSPDISWSWLSIMTEIAKTRNSNCLSNCPIQFRNDRNIVFEYYEIEWDRNPKPSAVMGMNKNKPSPKSLFWRVVSTFPDFLFYYWFTHIRSSNPQMSKCISSTFWCYSQNPERAVNGEELTFTNLWDIIKGDVLTRFMNQSLSGMILQVLGESADLGGSLN